MKVRGKNNEQIINTEDTIFEHPVYQFENPEIPGDYWDVYEIKGNEIKCKQLIPNTTIASMGCADGEETVKIRIEG